VEKKTGFNRRDFLKIVGVSTGAAATGCAKELPEKLIPYVVQPDEVIPGVATWYAASCQECEARCGTLIRTREGRAVKVEGNNEHPVNKGGLCSLGQSSIQGHYDPDRIREPLKRSANGSFKTISWKEAIDTLAETLASSASTKRAIVTQPETASLKKLIGEFATSVGSMTHYEYSLLGSRALDASIREVFGAGQQGTYDFSKADVIVNFGADFLGTWVSPVEFAKGYSSNRAPGKDGKISKFYHVEPRLSQTAANSDKWFRSSPGSEERLILALAASVVEKRGLSGAAASKIRELSSGLGSAELLKGSGLEQKDIETMSKALGSAKAPLVLAGDSSDGTAQIISHLLNSALGSVGKTLQLTPYKEKRADDLQVLLDAMKGEEKFGLVILSGINPLFSMPKEAEVAATLAKAGMLVSVSSQLDETTSLANLVLPLSSSFESWNDSHSRSGVYGLNQPSMSPLYQTQSLGDTLISTLANEKLAKPLKDISSFEDYIKAQWKQRTGSASFDTRWLTYVQNGGDWSERVQSNAAGAVQSPKVDSSVFKSHSEALALIAFPSLLLGDGRAANRPWAQEVPDPMTTAVWGSWIEMHPELAKKHSLDHGDVAQIVSKTGGAIEAPVYLTKNIHPQAVAVPIGQGHESLGRYANGVGTNPLSILPIGKFRNTGIEVRQSHATEELVTVQGNDSQLERGFLRTVSVDELGGHGHDSHGHKSDAHGAHGEGHDTHGLEFHHHDLHALGPQKEPKQMYKQMDHVQYNWGMSIDLAKCTGCTACVTACYAENNIAVVGKEFCAQGREMSWIRISRYLDGNDDQPVTGFQPMLCQHCGNAPCEPVCPVYATYHSDEGLNTMVYNRCVGTRYCGNNCSYKVRRFNWFDYDWPEPLNWQLNPDVTVRTVGVMEKCSFCIQRIREVQNNAKNEGREVKDGELQPACAATCPTDAITFGNRNDKESEVAKNGQSERGYKVLNAELNTQPAVTYLAKVTHSKVAGE
jgi:molybdopterin-containing oxidoreductase family iron-sulfur binding subunit